MSALATAGPARIRTRPAAQAPNRPAIRIAAFCALGLYGSLRWATLLAPRPVSRMLALLALAAVATSSRVIARRMFGEGAERARPRLVGPAAIAIALLAGLVMLPVAGVPAHELTHLHLGALGDGIGQGLQALPRVTVPYRGADPWVRTVLVLGGAVLLLDAAIVLAFTTSALGDARRAGAAAPLLGLAVVPSTLMRPQLPYLHGLLLLGLVAALVWGERLRRADVRAAALAAGLAGAVALPLAPALDRHHPLLNYEALAGKLAPAGGEKLDWTQRYGPLTWPRTGRELLAIRAAAPDYWKAENLDSFDGAGWVAAPLGGELLPPPFGTVAQKWTHELTVTFKGFETTDVIAAGYASLPPQHAPVAIEPGGSLGTWSAGVDLGPGDSYTIAAYSPHPLDAQLAAAGSAYPPGAAPYLSVLLPPIVGTPVAPDIEFAAFHSGGAPAVVNGVSEGSPSSLISGSPYAPAYALATRLAARAPTPIVFVRSVLNYLGRGFTYSEHPPPSPYPLETFLFTSKQGYCQQFAGAMALLLRMGGVPARVAVGFTPGLYDKASRQWLVTDLNAHAWVEAWFPTYGWVRFDPTPSSAPELKILREPSLAGATVRAAPATHRTLPDQPGSASSAGKAGAAMPRSGRGVPVALEVLGIALIAMILLLASSRIGRPRPEQLLDELARALRRSGRSAGGGLTLAQLEHRYRDDQAAAGYVRTLRLARYGGAEALPTAGQRRAVRWRLAEGLGPAGMMRALWALPPWPPGTGPRLLAAAGGAVRSGLRSLSDWVHGRRL